MNRSYNYDIAEGVCRNCGLKASHADEQACIAALLRIVGILSSRAWAGNAPQCIAGLRQAIGALEDRGRARRGR